MSIFKTPLNLSGQNPYSLEAIKYQDDGFKEHFIDLVSRYTYSEEEVAIEEYLLRISKLIFDRFKIKVRCVNEYSIAIGCPVIKRDHVLYTNLRREYMDNKKVLADLKKAKYKVGNVNLETAQVGGYFSEVEFTLFMFQPVVQLLSPEEAAAALLHEIGHAFTYFEYIGRQVSTNVFLDAVTQRLAKADVKEIETILMDTSNYIGMPKDKVEDLIKTQDAKLVQVEIISAAYAKNRSELGTDIYDGKEWESLADQFATRFMSARELASALDKLWRLAPNESTRGTAMYMFVEASKIVAVTSLYVVTGLIDPFLGLLLIPFIAWLTVGITTYNETQSPHDKPEQRMLRIRTQLVEQLKHIKGSGVGVNELRLSIKSDLDFIDEILSKLKDRQGVLTLLSSLLSPDIRKLEREKKLHQVLEALAYNKMFEAENDLNLI